MLVSGAFYLTVLNKNWLETIKTMDKMRLIFYITFYCWGWLLCFFFFLMVEYGHYYNLIVQNCLCILNLMASVCWLANTLLDVEQAVVKKQRLLWYETESCRLSYTKGYVLNLLDGWKHLKEPRNGILLQTT